MPFPNKDTQFPTGEKQVETARQGGIASGVARRKKKLLSELINNEFEKDITVKRNGEPVTLTKKELAAVRLISIINDKSTTDKDFLKALEFARDTIGEKPKEQVELSTIGEQKEKLDKLIEQMDE